METDRFARARVLMAQGRYDLAADEVAARLGEDPEDPEGYILTAICRHSTNRPGAWEAARRAIELDPNDARSHFVLSLTELRRGNFDESEAAVRRAIELYSWNAAYFGQLAAVHLSRYRWTEALAAADEGLAIDPDDEGCLNYRAAALTKLGRHDEAAHTLEGTLAKNPEDAYTHANRGWTLLHENEPRKAIGHFRESLRLDPMSAWAKAGMLEALRAKNWFYRRVLQFFLRLSRFPPRVQFGLIIGMVVLAQVVGSLGKQMPAAEPFFLALLLVYVAFVAATWFADHIINVLLLFDRDGRVLLDRPQKVLSVACTLLVLAVLFLAVSAVMGWDKRSVPAAVFVFLFAVHLASVFQIPRGRFRWYGIGLSAVIMGAFAYERVQRFEWMAEADRIMARAKAHDAKVDEYQASEGKLPAEQVDAIVASIRASKAEISRSMDRAVARREQLDSWQSVLGFASLGGLLLHATLMVRAGRPRAE